MRIFTLLFALAASMLSAQETRVIKTDFTSQPEGASVIVDDVVRGVTPLTLYDLKPGRHHVRYELSGYERVDDFLFLREGNMLQKNAVLTPVKGILLLLSEPDGCDITVDGSFSLGKTPRLITSLDAKETHRLLLQKPGYQSRSVEIRFDGRVPLVKKQSLIIDSGTIEITSEPSGAEVTVNGIARGTTPVTVSGVPKGRATVTFSKEGFENASRELSMVAGETQTLFIKLDGIPGTMTLSSVPEGARFYVDGQPQGKAPVVLKNLKSGDYTVRAELEGHAPVTRTVRIENGSSVSEEFQLENVMGRIELRTIPSGVTVFLDGKKIGTTKPGATEGGSSAVFAIENVEQGEHTLTLNCQGYADVTRHPVVENRTTAKVNVRLKRVFTPDVEITTSSGTYRGVLVSSSPDGLVVEVKMGINRTFLHSEIRKITHLRLPR